MSKPATFIEESAEASSDQNPVMSTQRASGPARWNAGRPWWIMVVRSDRSTLCARLRHTFAGAGWVEVVLDRRREEQRQHTVLTEVDRHLADRRATGGERMETTYRLANRGDGFEVCEAVGMVPVRCPDCGVTVWFEMPRFAAPPSRLELDVLHERPKYARHVVELAAFTACGRPLLTSRTWARAWVGRVS